MGIDNAKMVSQHTIRGNVVERLGELEEYQVMIDRESDGGKIYFVDKNNNVMNGFIYISQKDILGEDYIDVGMIYVKGSLMGCSDEK